MANIKPIPNLRNQHVYQDIAAAKQALEAQLNTDIVSDGITIAARYYDNNTVKTILGVYFVSGNTKTVTIAGEGSGGSGDVFPGNGIDVTPGETGSTISAKPASNSATGIVNPITVDGDGIKFSTYIDAGDYE